MPQDKLPEPGEFTRIFKRQHMSGQGGDSADAEKQDSENSGILSNSAEPSAVAPPPATASSSSEPGEFTRYFTGGSPRPSANTPLPTPTRSSYGVQRPSTPVPPRTISADSSGSFTERFGTGPRSSEPNVSNPQLDSSSDLLQHSSAQTGGFFDQKPIVPQPSSSKQDAPGEYTKMFLTDHPPAPRQSAVASAPSRPMMSDSVPMVAEPGLSGRNIPLPSPVSAVPQGPSEFTTIQKGRQAVAPEASPSSGGSGSNSTTGTRKLPVSVSAPPISMPSMGGGSMNIQGASASASMSGANMQTPLGSASMQAPSIPPLNVPGGGGAISGLSYPVKMTLFFSLLAILAVILVVVVVATQK